MNAHLRGVLGVHADRIYLRKGQFSSMREFRKDKRGDVHLFPASGGEHALCGTWKYDEDDKELPATNKRTVTCSVCSRIILECRSVKTRYDGLLYQSSTKPIHTKPLIRSSGGH